MKCGASYAYQGAHGANCSEWVDRQMRYGGLVQARVGEELGTCFPHGFTQRGSFLDSPANAADVIAQAYRREGYRTNGIFLHVECRRPGSK